MDCDTTKPIKKKKKRKVTSKVAKEGINIVNIILAASYMANITPLSGNQFIDIVIWSVLIGANQTFVRNIYSYYKNII